MSDPQFGMYAKDEDFAHETANFEFAIATANRLKPAFVVITGDLINKAGDAAQAAEYKRIAAKLDPKIKLYSAPGNHDVGMSRPWNRWPATASGSAPIITRFRSGDIAGIVLNSNLEKGADKVPEEAAKMEAWFRTELERPNRRARSHVIVFQHIPFFLKDPDEDGSVFQHPEAGPRHAICRCCTSTACNGFSPATFTATRRPRRRSDMVTTGPVGMPLEGAKSGMRIVTVNTTGVSQKFFDLGELPDNIQ